MRTTSALLYLDGVGVSFDGFRALNKLSLAVEPGELRAVIGPNGAGKTTMMDVITGKTRPDRGDATFDGTTDLLTLEGPRTASSSLLGWRNRVPPERIDAILDTVGLLAHRDRLAGRLSHGQKQWLEIGMLL